MTMPMKKHLVAAMITLALLMVSSYRATARYCETSGGIKCYNDEMCYNLCSDSPGCRFTSGYCRSRDSTCVCLREKTAVWGEKANDGEGEAAAGHGGGSGGGGAMLIS
ncbi:uncharacterized protein LOC110435341 [Sorghum bicolor]|uniref:Knottin scorpion toxin-like domain-containing protein n=1 Tax=Sorghum bicolor TaxID=4558 RepID=A0A1B6PQE7_SORBI|nr:uncharacterized protein LOC110435341 [Sorghum bicolor]KXG27886.1 hypothetical protein SORBI_3005G058500 [Sorghum bicolor]|eukprot:XP_021316476.1 uncharacterized protein LOC110435341 [Sorghum bicolor]